MAKYGESGPNMDENRLAKDEEGLNMAKVNQIWLKVD